MLSSVANRVVEGSLVQLHPRDTNDLLPSLLRNAEFPHSVTDRQVIETHISWVLLTGDYAYKIKKPVDLGFVDFTSLAKRRYFCEEELRLNRRLAPDLYLEVVPIGGSPNKPIFGKRPAAEKEMTIDLTI